MRRLDLIAYTVGVLVTLAIVGLPHNPLVVGYWMLSALPAYAIGRGAVLIHLGLVAVVGTILSRDPLLLALWYAYQLPGVIMCVLASTFRWYLQSVVTGRAGRY